LAVHGENRHYYNIVAPIRDDDKIHGILGVNVDITERKRAEEALQAANDELEQRVKERTAELEQANEQLKREIEERKQAQEALQREQDALRRMLRASDRERQLITYEIHDSVAQRLVGAMMQFQAYEQAEDREAESAKAQFDAGLAILREASADARRLMNRTRAPVLDKYGVTMAIADLIDHFMDVPDSPEITYDSDVSFNRLALVLENAIYRVAQEAIANACIHSKTEMVRVTLTQVDEDVTLEVQDWGTGFDQEDVAEDRYGLAGMRERARLLGKGLEIESTPGKGTRICATFPVLERNNNVNGSNSAG